MIKLGNEDVKLIHFADGMSCFKKDESPYDHFFCVIEETSVFSGLTVRWYRGKETEIFCLGSETLKTFPKEFKTFVKNLGGCFSYGEALRKRKKI